MAGRGDLGRAQDLELTEHARRSRELWNEWAPGWIAEYGTHRDSDEPVWGNWATPEAQLRVQEGVSAADVLELACGSARWSAWLTRKGARVVALDHSERQLDGVRVLQRAFGLDFQLVHASAERIPLADRSFDLVLSEYGASLWCDPGLWVLPWPGTETSQFGLGDSAWIRLLWENGLSVERLIEVQAPRDTDPPRRWAYLDPDWASKWPSELIWKARKRA